MTDRLKRYLNTITAGMKCSESYKQEIEDELSCHMELLYSELTDEGYDPNQAEDIVINRMGDPENIRKGFNLIVYKRVFKKAAKSIAVLSAACALFTVIYGINVSQKELNEYTAFLKGIEAGKVDVTDTWINDLYSPAYKNQPILVNAIKGYSGQADNHKFDKMVVTEDYIIICTKE